MKFSLFILPSWPEAEPSHQSRIFHEAVEQIQYAEELGFDAVWLAEHHFTRFGIVPSAIPFATYVAARTKRIRIGTGVSVLTFHHRYSWPRRPPCWTSSSQGRLDFGVGRGQVVYEYNNFKVEYDSRTQRFKEIVDIILGLVHVRVHLPRPILQCGRPDHRSGAIATASPTHVPGRVAHSRQR